MASPHDRLFRHVFADPVHAGPLLNWLLPRPTAADIDWSTLQRVPGSRVDPRQRASYSDLLFTARIAGRPGRIHLLLDHKSKPDRWAALQVLHYVVGIWLDARRSAGGRGRLPLVLPIVIHLGRRPWRTSTRIRDLVDWPAEAGARRRYCRHLPSFRFYLADLARCSEAELRAAAITLQGTWTVANLQFLDDGDDERVLSAIAAWADVGRQVLASPTGREALEAVSSYILSVTRVDARRLEVLIHEEFGAAAMKKFESTADRLRAEGRAQAKQEFESTADRLRAEGRAQAMDEFLSSTADRLRAEGHAQAQLGLLVRLLERRFGPLPPAALGRVRAATPAQLDRWIDRVFDAVALDDLLDG